MRRGFSEVAQQEEKLLGKGLHAGVMLAFAFSCDAELDRPSRSEAL